MSTCRAYKQNRSKKTHRGIASEASCPKTKSDWADAVQKAIHRASNPLDLGTIDNDIARLEGLCTLDAQAQDYVQNCLSAVDQRGQADEDFYSVGIKLKPTWADIQPSLILSTALNNSELRDAIENIKTPQKKLDKLMGDLLAQLPQGSRAFQFMSVIVPERSIIVVIPNKDGGYTTVHTHSNADHMLIVWRTTKPPPEGDFISSPPHVDFFEGTNSGNVENSKELTEHCVSCHRGGSIKILPKPGSVHSFTAGVADADILPWFDSIRPKSSDLTRYDTSSLGPAMGPEDPPWRTDEYVMKCAKKAKPNVTLAEAKTIRRQMNCVGCHESEGPGKELLQYPMHLPSFKLDIFENIIRNGYMPKHPTTPKPLREALLSCLKQEFYGGFSDKKYSGGNPEPGILMRSLFNPTCAPKSSTGDAPGATDSSAQ